MPCVTALPEEAAVISKIVLVLFEQQQGETILPIPHAHLPKLLPSSIRPDNASALACCQNAHALDFQDLNQLALRYLNDHRASASKMAEISCL